MDLNNKDKLYDLSQIEILDELPIINAKLIGEESSLGNLIFEKS